MRAAAALLLALCFTTTANAATVVSVGDGDTMRVSEGSRRLTIRLACIDAPETSQRPLGCLRCVDAREANSEPSAPFRDTHRVAVPH